LPASLLPVRPKPTGEGGETPSGFFGRRDLKLGGGWDFDFSNIL